MHPHETRLLSNPTPLAGDQATADPSGRRAFDTDVGWNRLWEDPAVDFAERAARNEEIFRSLNARIEEGVERHGVATAVPYHCECGVASCFETVELMPSHYEGVLRERYRFIVVPGHEDPRIERVVERHPDHLVVEKRGEAREQLDHDHPQGYHQKPDG
jgi:hypothetical protein